MRLYWAAMLALSSCVVTATSQRVQTRLCGDSAYVSANGSSGEIVIVKGDKNCMLNITELRINAQLVVYGLKTPDGRSCVGSEPKIKVNKVAYCVSSGDHQIGTSTDSAGTLSFDLQDRAPEDRIISYYYGFSCGGDIDFSANSLLSGGAEAVVTSVGYPQGNTAHTDCTTRLKNIPAIGQGKLKLEVSPGIGSGVLYFEHEALEKPITGAEWVNLSEGRDAFIRYIAQTDLPESVSVKFTVKLQVATCLGQPLGFSDEEYELPEEPYVLGSKVRRRCGSPNPNATGYLCEFKDDVASWTDSADVECAQATEDPARAEEAKTAKPDNQLSRESVDELEEDVLSVPDQGQNDGTRGTTMVVVAVVVGVLVTVAVVLATVVCILRRRRRGQGDSLNHQTSFKLNSTKLHLDENGYALVEPNAQSPDSCSPGEDPLIYEEIPSKETDSQASRSSRQLHKPLHYALSNISAPPHSRPGSGPAEAAYSEIDDAPAIRDPPPKPQRSRDPTIADKVAMIENDLYGSA